jgi:hypothetical protein
MMTRNAQAMIEVAFNEGYYGHKTDAKCPYLSTGDNLALKNAWYRGKYAAQHDEVPTVDDLNSYITGLSRQNATAPAEDDVNAALVTLRRLEAKLDQILAKLG